MLSIFHPSICLKSAHFGSYSASFITKVWYVLYIPRTERRFSPCVGPYRVGFIIYVMKEAEWNFETLCVFNQKKTNVDYTGLCQFRLMVTSSKMLRKVQVEAERWRGVEGIIFCAHFLSRSQNCEKRLLSSSCLPFCPSAWNNSAPIWRIFMKFDIWIVFRKSVLKNSSFVKIRQE